MVHPADQISLPSWLLQRLIAELNEPPLPDSLLGPIDAILSDLFPTRQRFVIEPQIARAPYEEDEDFEADLDALGSPSIDSTNSPEEPRGLGMNNGLHFHLLKAPGTLADDILIGVVSIKRDEIDAQQAEIQFRRYLERVALKRKRIPDLGGYLIIGPTTLLFRLNDEQVAVLDRGMPTVAVNHEPEDFISSVRQLARATWDLGVDKLSHSRGPCPFISSVRQLARATWDLGVK